MFALTIFTVTHNYLCMLFISRTTFSLLHTYHLLSGSGERVCQCSYIRAAVDFVLLILTLQTVSMEWSTSAKCGVGVLHLGWHPMDGTSISSQGFSGNPWIRISCCSTEFVASVCKVATCWKVPCCRNNCKQRSRNSDLNKQTILVHLVRNFFEPYTAKCRQLRYLLCCQLLQAAVASCVCFELCTAHLLAMLLGPHRTGIAYSGQCVCNMVLLSKRWRQICW
jgi:hypothetical protein